MRRRAASKASATPVFHETMLRGLDRCVGTTPCGQKLWATPGRPWTATIRLCDSGAASKVARCVRDESAVADYLVIETSAERPGEILGQQSCRTAHSALDQARMITGQGARVRIRTPGGDEYSVDQFAIVMVRDLR